MGYDGDWNREEKDYGNDEGEADKKKNFFHVKHLLQGTAQVAVWQDFTCHFIIPWLRRGSKGDMDHEKGILRGSAFVITESIGFSEKSTEKENS